MKWYIVPNFINLNLLDDMDHYHLAEGYCTYIMDCAPRGKFYNKVLIDGNYYRFLDVVGFPNWWENYSIERNPIKRFFTRKCWKLKKKVDIK